MKGILCGNTLIVKMKNKDKIKVISLSILLVASVIVICFISIYIPQINKAILDNVFIQRYYNQAAPLCMIWMILVLIISILRVISNCLISNFGISFSQHIKKKLMLRVFKFNLSFFDKISSGELSERIREVDNIAGMFNPMLINVIVTFISAIGGVVIVWNIEKKFLFFYLCIMPIIAFISYRTAKKYRNNLIEMAQMRGVVSGKLHENILGITELKSMNIAQNRANEINAINAAIYKKSFETNLFYSISSESINVLTLVMSIVITLVCVKLYSKNYLSIGDYVALVQYTTMILAPAQMLSTIYSTLQPVITTFKRLHFFDYEVERNVSIGNRLDSIESLNVLNLSFGYMTKKVLDNVDFSLKRGEKLVIQGENGTGKTTIVKLLLGLYENYEGQILYNGHNLRELSLEDLRKKIAVVFQDSYLFSGTLKENICLGNEAVNEKELKNILKLVSLWDGVSEEILKKTLDCPIIEGGKNLSGGQRRRIVIARALIRKPDILILDEVTTFLDRESKSVISDFIQQKLESIMCIIITHDDDIAKLGDNVLILNSSVE